MYSYDPEAPTPPSGYHLATGYRVAPRARVYAALKWGCALVGLLIVVVGSVIGVRALHNLGRAHTATTLSGTGIALVIQQESTTVANVQCPTVPIRAGYVFDCSATIAGTTVNDIKVTENDVSGHFSWVLPAAHT